MTHAAERLRHEALAAWEAGHDEAALDQLTEALGAAEGEGSATRELEARLLIDRAIILTELSRFFESEGHSHHALLRLETLSAPHLRAVGHEALAAALFHLEAPREAARHWQRALDHWQAAGGADTDTRLRLAANVANAWWEAGDNARAAASARTGLALAPEWADAPLGRMAARILVRAILDGGEARAEAWQLARTLAEAPASPRWEQVVGHSLCGSLALADRRARDAHRWFRKAEAAAQEPAAEGEEGVGVDDAVRLFCDHADALAALEHWSDVADHVQVALECVEAGLEGSLTRQRRARLLRRAGAASGLGALAAARSGDAVRAFQLLERGQAVELRGALLADLSTYRAVGAVARARFLEITSRICAVQQAIEEEEDDAKRRTLRTWAETLLDERHAILFPQQQRTVLGR